MMITISNLYFEYNRDNPIFTDFNWNIEKGEMWSIIGPSGCGKTTLLYLLAGLYQPDSGDVNIDGIPIKTTRLSTGLILQDYGLLPWATAIDNVSLGLKIRGFEKSVIKQKTREWLCHLDIDSVSHHYPAELSGGQRQRVAIARTLALQPDLLLMDEPFASLDALTREDLQNLTVKLWQEVDLTTVLVTHNIEEAVFLSRRIIVLRQPPNTSPILIDNPDSGSPGYRNTLEFTKRCQQVREIVERDQSN